MKKPITKKELSKKYLVSYNTFLKWLSQIPELKVHSKQRLLTPNQIEIIFKFLGNPYK
jgi:hypothetical protein